MLLELTLKSRIAKLAALALVVGVCAVLGVSTAKGFVIGTLTDERIMVSQGELEQAAFYFPNSARLKGRLAEAEIMNPERDLQKAEQTARDAINLSPNDFGLWMVMAAIREAGGDKTGAENALRRAGSLAPANADVQWRLANLMLRQGRIDESIDSFRIAVKANRSLMPAAYDLVWRYTKGSPQQLALMTPSDAPSQIALSRYLFQQTRPNQALAVFQAIEPKEAKACPASWDFLRELMAGGEVALARGVWMTLAGQQDGNAASNGTNVIYNPGFEQDPIQNADQFDWRVTPTDAAEVFIDPGVSHSGSRSLRVEFAGHDTTRLDGNIRQLTVIQPGLRYRLSFYWRTENLVTTDGPQIAASSSDFPDWSVKTVPIGAGSKDWQHESVEFGAPGTQGSRQVPVTISIVRTPKLHYEAPMRGIVWFDDFTLSEVQ